MLTPICTPIGHRSTWRAYAALAVLLVGGTLGLTACSPPSRQAQSTITRHGDDAVVSGAEPEFRDSTAGDVMLAGSEIHFSGAADGDYLGVGGRQTIDGRIHGALRAAGGTVRVLGSVDRNATIAGGTVEVSRVSVIGRNGYLAGGTVRVEGAVRGVLLVSGGTVVLDGPVGGDVEVNAGELFVGPRAAVTGGLRYRVPSSKLHMDPNARVSGRVAALPAEPEGRQAYVFGLLWMLGFLVAGAAVVAVLPRWMTDTADMVRQRAGHAALVGLGGLILIPLAILVTACTIMGLPLAFLATLLYVVLLYISRIGVAIWLGRWVLGARARLGRNGAIVNFGAGALILMLVRLIPILGPVVAIATIVVGLGALLIHARTRYTTPSASPQ